MSILERLRQRAAADAAHVEFRDAKSEFVGILKLWDAYRAAHEELTQSQLRKWCEKRFLGFLRMREWRELHRQLKLQCEELGWNEEPPAAENHTSSSPRTRDKREARRTAEGRPEGRAQRVIPWTLSFKPA